METKAIKYGTRIRVKVFDDNLRVTFEPATIGRRFKRDQIPVGFYPVRFDADGTRLLVHESSFVIASD